MASRRFLFSHIASLISAYVFDSEPARTEPVLTNTYRRPAVSALRNERLQDLVFAESDILYRYCFYFIGIQALSCTFSDADSHRFAAVINASMCCGQS